MPSRSGAVLLFASAACGAEEVVVPLPSNGHVGLSTRGPSAFRVRLLVGGDHEAIDTPMVQPDGPDAEFQRGTLGGASGIEAVFGFVGVTDAGVVVLRDSDGNVLTESDPLGSSGGLCAAQAGTDVASLTRVGGNGRTVDDESACCDACKSTSGCKHWIFATDGGTSEGNCWLGSAVSGAHASSKRVLGGDQGSGIGLSSKGGKLYGGGGGQVDGTQLVRMSSTPRVDNKAVYTPYYYSTDGYSALGVVNEYMTTGDGKTDVFPASYASDSEKVSWSPSGPFELYLMPASSLDLGTQAYYALTGLPRVPPRHAFGFVASRYGWEGKDYIEDMIQRFRSGEYPIDAIICDFEWFTNFNDYNLPPQGAADYFDFGFNNQTFPEPQEQLARYRKEFNMRVAGIRKPRLGNTDLLNLARSNRWLRPGKALAEGQLGYAEGRHMNYSDPAVRDWYAQQQEHYYEDGMEYFWNDEGENDYFTFYYWSLAQQQSLRLKSETKRFYAINRAFSPGMARLGVTTWTGDINPTWEDLVNTPGLVLNWGLGGMPYVACDIGGFTSESEGELLTRWYQVGAFMPTMRVHSTNTATPHFPFLWPDKFAAVMKSALELRYRLLPYHYSLAHSMYAGGPLWMRPLVAEFPEDNQAALITSQWLDGRLLVAPVLRQDSKKSIYLPAGDWHAFGTNEVTKGPQTIEGAAALTEVPVFVPAGTILPLAPVVQYTDALPGGPLEVQVYPGSDASFVLSEDDGDTVAYENGEIRRTTLRWDDASQALSWEVDGRELDLEHAFTQILITVFSPQSQSPVSSSTATIGSSGCLSLLGPCTPEVAV